MLDAAHASFKLLTVGLETESSGNVIVDGAHTLLTIGDDLILGTKGDGTLSVSNGAIVNVKDTVQLTGTNPAVLEQNGVGTVLVSGNGSTLNAAKLLIGVGDLTNHVTAQAGGAVKITKEVGIWNDNAITVSPDGAMKSER